MSLSLVKRPFYCFVLSSFFSVPVYDFVSFAAICVKNVFFSPLFYVVYLVNVDPWGVVVLLIFMLCSVTLLRKTLCCNPRVLLDTWTNSWLNCDNEDIYIFCLFKITLSTISLM